MPGPHKGASTQHNNQQVLVKPKTPTFRKRSAGKRKVKAESKN